MWPRQAYMDWNGSDRSWIHWLRRLRRCSFIQYPPLSGIGPRDSAYGHRVLFDAERSRWVSWNVRLLEIARRSSRRRKSCWSCFLWGGWWSILHQFYKINSIVVDRRRRLSWSDRKNNWEFRRRSTGIRNWTDGNGRVLDLYGSWKIWKVWKVFPKPVVLYMLLPWSPKQWPWAGTGWFSRLG